MLVVPYERARRELRVSNSRFIAELAPVGSADEARAFFSSMRAEFPDATHCVPAYVLGGGNSVAEFCSDDGEPSGTAGRPLLAVLKGSGLGDAAIAVVRYFGGTLLGTGGLVKAYADAGRLVLAAARRAELLPGFRARLELPYHLFDRAKLLFEACGARVVAEGFAEAVTVELEAPEDARSVLEARLADLGAGAVALEELGPTRLRRPVG